VHWLEPVLWRMWLEGVKISQQVFTEKLHRLEMRSYGCLRI
jgi:hypothetical protein